MAADAPLPPRPPTQAAPLAPAPPADVPPAPATKTVAAGVTNVAQTNGLAGSIALPMPKGYRNGLELRAAMRLKQVSMIENNRFLPPGVRENRDIAYGQGGSRPLRLDLYRPAKMELPAPALIFVHAGAWNGGDRADYFYYVVRYARMGYAAISVDFRRASDAPFPAAVEDIKCAVRWTKANAKQLQIDPNKIALIGGSSGAHLALLAGYASASAGFEGKGGWPDRDSQVQAVVAFYGPTDLTVDPWKADGAVLKFLGLQQYSQMPGLFARASPITYLSKQSPPTLLFHGTLDEVVSTAQSESLAARLKELGVPHVFHRMEGWPHSMDMIETVNEWCQAQMNAFLARHLPLPKSP